MSERPTRARAFRRSVHYVQALASPEMLRTTFASFDSVHVEMTRAGLPAGGFRFGLRDLPILEVAVNAALSSRDSTFAQHVGTVELPSGAAIEIGSAYGAVPLRMRLPTGARRSVTTIRGAELKGLHRAICDLKHFVSKNPAADFAFD